jgi:hypothetical protein
MNAPIALVPEQPETDAVSTALVEVTGTNKRVTELYERGRQLSEQFRKVAFDVTTTKGMADACKARQQLREEVRYPLQQLQEAGSKMLGTMQRQFNERAKALIAEVSAWEKPIHEQIVAEEARKEAARVAKTEAEERRRSGLLTRVGEISGIPTHCIGMTSQQIRDHLAATEAIEIDDSFAEYRNAAAMAKDNTVAALRKMLDAQVALEAEQAEVAAERERQRVAREALEAREREHAADRAAVEQERARQIEANNRRETAIQARLKTLREIAEAADGGPRDPDHVEVEKLMETMEDLRKREMTEDRFGSHVEEAKELQTKAVAALRRWQVELSMASISPEWVRAKVLNGDKPIPTDNLSLALMALRAMEIHPDVFDDRVGEAQAMRDASVKLVEETLEKRKAAASAGPFAPPPEGRAAHVMQMGDNPEADREIEAAGVRAQVAEESHHQRVASLTKEEAAARDKRLRDNAEEAYEIARCLTLAMTVEHIEGTEHAAGIINPPALVHLSQRAQALVAKVEGMLQ